MTTILLTAAEPSGDAMGASLMRAIRAQRADVRFIGAGGRAMAEAGLEGNLSTEKLAVMGPLDAIAALPRATGLANKIGRMSAAEKPDVAILIDSWAFSKIVADNIKKRAPETALVKLAVPQVWASRPHRAEVAAQLFDLLLCLLPFEPEYFSKYGGVARFVGNPNFQQASEMPRSGASFRSRHDVGDAPLLLLLPGSRGGEIKKLLPVFRETVAEVNGKVPGMRVAVVAAPSVEDKVRSAVAEWNGEVIVVPGTERFSAFDAGDVAVAASGTVTTELALSGTPMVVTYKVGSLAAYWARKVMTTPYVTILNVAADKEIIPERLQQDCMPAQLCADVVRLFNDEEARRKQISAFRRLLPKLIGRENASEAAADEVLDLVDRKNRGHLHGSAAR